MAGCSGSQSMTAAASIVRAAGQTALPGGGAT